MPAVCGGIFFALFLFGALQANLGLSDQALWTGFFSENQLRQFAAQPGGAWEFVKFALRFRLLVWGVLIVGGLFFWGEAACALWTGWLGFSGGFLFCALIRRHGIRGMLLMGAMQFPQILFYLAAYLALFRLIGIYRRAARKRRCMYLLLAACATGVFFLGILAEYFVSPAILERLISAPLLTKSAFFPAVIMV